MVDGVAGQALTAGICAGDVIVAVNGICTSSLPFGFALGTLKVSEAMHFSITTTSHTLLSYTPL
jgi:predicted metalloprotease with PDZ domain